MDIWGNKPSLGHHRVNQQVQTGARANRKNIKKNQVMCYFTKRVLNKRFLPNRKNGWNPPVCTDERFRYVEVECGHCFECRKKREENGESETTNN